MRLGKADDKEKSRKENSKMVTYKVGTKEKQKRIVYLLRQRQSK